MKLIGQVVLCLHMRGFSMTQQTEGKSQSLVAAWISLISNIILTLLKTVVGFLFKSPSLVADGVHNAADVVASGASLASMKLSKLPADEEHPYGHGKAEVLASGFVAILLGIIALYMIFESVKAFFAPVSTTHVISLVAGVVSLVWKQILYVYTIRIGKRENSKGLIATAYDHLSDVYASIAVVIGLGIALTGQHFHWPIARYGDALASIVVSLIILRLAFRMGVDAGNILMERNVPEEQLLEYECFILDVPQVKRIDRIRAREHGHYIIVDVRVSVPGDLTVKTGHDISRSIKRGMMKRFPNIQEVLVHINPWFAKEDEETVQPQEV